MHPEQVPFCDLRGCLAYLLNTIVSSAVCSNLGLDVSRDGESSLCIKTALVILGSIDGKVGACIGQQII